MTPGAALVRAVSAWLPLRGTRPCPRASPTNGPPCVSASISVSATTTAASRFTWQSSRLRAAQGAHSVVHAARIVDLSADLPIVVEVIDTKEAIERFLPVLTGMVADGLITVDDVRIVYRGEGAPRS
jgi:Uncharacterized ACR, COG1993